LIGYGEDVRGLYSTPNIVKLIKSRRMRWAGHVARVGERVLLRNLKESNSFEVLGVDRRMLLKRNLMKQDGTE
jgi:hypothetical protein